MKLSPRIRILLGVVTASLFLMTSVAFASEGNSVLAGILGLLGVYRLYVLIKQIRWTLQADPED